MDADAMVRAVVDVLNAWAEADMDHLRAEHAELSALALPRRPAVLPTTKDDEAHRRHVALMREDERLALQRAGLSRRRPHTGSASERAGRRETP